MSSELLQLSTANATGLSAAFRAAGFHPDDAFTVIGNFVRVSIALSAGLPRVRHLESDGTGVPEMFSLEGFDASVGDSA
jgi:hypothetical protein